jgi:hypothetical protein
LSVPEYVHRLYQENDQASGDEPPVDSLPPTLSNQPVSPRPGKPYPDRRQRRANNELQSRTDPEASVISRQRFGLHLAYKAHLAMAGQRGQVITAAIATRGATTDEHLLGEMPWQHRRLSGLPISEVVADAKYGTMVNYVYLDKVGISAFIPPRRHGYQASGVWGRDHLRWLPEEDSFLCPAGQKLRRWQTEGADSALVDGGSDEYEEGSSGDE